MLLHILYHFLCFKYREGKLATVVVHPTGIHEAQHVPNVRGFQHLGSVEFQEDTDINTKQMLHGKEKNRHKFNQTNEASLRVLVLECP